MDRGGQERPTVLDLLIRHEADLDFEETAQLAAEGFGKPAGSFSAEKLRWLYDRAFSHGTTVLSAYADERKVGQVALVHQRVRVEGASQQAIQLVDLFILKAYRSRAAIAGLYGEVERFCQAEDIRFIIGVPNPSGARVNVRYLSMAPFLRLEIRAGLAVPAGGRRGVVSADLDRIGRNEAVALFSRVLPLSGNGLDWTPEALWERFRDGSTRFGLHATDDLLLVSSPRVSRRVPYVLLCAFLARPGARIASGDVRALTGAACALHRRPLFVYAGINAAVPLPGRTLPDRLRPSPMEVQIRDFASPAVPVAFDRFEMLDFDFA